jgi:hypothetical protein
VFDKSGSSLSKKLEAGVMHIVLQLV